MVRFLIRWTLFLSLLGWITGSALADMEQRFLYFPDPVLIGSPEARNLAFEEVRFQAADGVDLHGWYLPGEKGWPLVLFFHGNAGNISHRLDLLARLRGLGAAIFIFDYRGYGLSDGLPGEEGIYRDARAARAWLEDRGWATERMIYFGRSLGAGPAVQLALEEPPGAVVLDAPIPSVEALGKHHYPVLYRLAGWLVKDAYDNLGKIGKLQAPLLVFQGGRDTIVPPGLTRRLVERAPSGTVYQLLPDAGHNDLDLQGEAYWDPWRKLLGQVRGRESEAKEDGGS